MKKIILLVFVTLFCCVGYSQAQTTKKMTRQEKKRKRRKKLWNKPCSKKPDKL